MLDNVLTALPVYNEAAHLTAVLDEVLRFCNNVLVVDDGSTDDTPSILADRGDVQVLTHLENRGYGAALASAFSHARAADFEALVTIDCDGQHQPSLIPRLIDELWSNDVDILSGSRYLQAFPGDGEPPPDRLHINMEITRQLNESLGLQLSDAFCGFKAYRTSALAQLRITEQGYAMPLELWVQAADLQLTVAEFPIPLIYLDEERSFGGSLDDADQRMSYYLDVLGRAMTTRSGC